MVKRALFLGLLVGLTACGQSPASYQTQQTQNEKLLKLINDYRVRYFRYNVPALIPNPTLQRVAQEHTDDMVQNEYFGRISPSGSSASQRLENTGIGERGYGILLRVVPRQPVETLPDRILEDDPDGWVKNENDMSYLRNGDFKYGGIGMTYHSREDAYYVALFMSVLGQPPSRTYDWIRYGRERRRRLGQ